MNAAAVALLIVFGGGFVLGLFVAAVGLIVNEVRQARVPRYSDDTPKFNEVVKALEKARTE